MGQLIYAGTTYVITPDETLAYLDALTRHAFSEGKSFIVVLRGESNACVLWFGPQIPIQFIYEHYETVEIPRESFRELYNEVIESGLHFIGTGPLPYEFTGERTNSDGSGDGE